MRPSAIPAALLVLLAGCSSQQPSGEPASSAPTGAVSAEPSIAPGAISFHDIEAGTELEPGTYVLHYADIGGVDDFPTLAITFTAPANWTRVRIDGLVWHDLARLGFLVVDNIYTDPCDPAAGLSDPPVGPSVDDLTTSLRSLPGWETAVGDEAVVSGFGGQHLQLTMPDDAPACDGDDSRLFQTLGSPGYTLAPGPGVGSDLWVLDVDGTRLVISATSLPGASADVRAELQAMVESIVIQP